MIKPTIGRVVWFWPKYNPEEYPDQQPYSAQIAYVWSDSLINIGYLDRYGVASSATIVYLWNGEGDRPACPHCEWMPYQQGQAKKEAEASALALGAAARSAGLVGGGY